MQNLIITDKANMKSIVANLFSSLNNSLQDRAVLKTIEKELNLENRGNHLTDGSIVICHKRFHGSAGDSSDYYKKQYPNAKIYEICGYSDNDDFKYFIDMIKKTKDVDFINFFYTCYRCRIFGKILGRIVMSEHAKDHLVFISNVHSVDNIREYTRNI